MSAQNFDLSPPEEGSVMNSPSIKSIGLVASTDQNQDVSYPLVVAQVVLVLGALLIFALWFTLALMQDKPFNSLDKVYTNTQLSSKELREVNLVLTGSSSVADMQENLQRIPWINQVAVSRRISGRDDILILDLTKAQPLARMRNGNLLFSDGKLVEGDASDYDIPIVSGELISAEKGKGGNRAKVSHAEATALGETISALSKLSSSYGLDIVEYKISQAGAINVLMGNGGIVKVGVRDHRQRLKRLARFLSSYKDEILKVQDIDLRHDKGLAVLWNN